jgi:activator of HSP90 ATPase
VTTPVIQQAAKFYTSPETLFGMYMDSATHSAATGAPAKMSRETSGSWSAHGGKIGGKNLMILPGRMIVQAWRAAHWKKEDISVVVLCFSKLPGGARLDLVHVGVPEYDHEGVSLGWPKYYWEPWRLYIKAQKKRRRG